jgi:GT2 family glycosyltransferase
VFDDGSIPPARPAGAGDLPVRVIHDSSRPGYIVGRNRLVREAAGEFVLLLDDDTRVLSAASIERGIAVLENDRRLAGAVGFAQANQDGSPWPAGMQAARVDYPCLVPSFIGFAHLLRRDIFVSLGGYREDFVFYGEEKEYCLRLIEAGYRTVYLPDALVAHEPAPAGRSRVRYLRFVARNDCLNALYNDPFPRVFAMLAGRYYLYFRMRRGWGITDPWGGVWLAREIVRGALRALPRRRPVSLSTIRTWRALRNTPAPYAPPGAGRA